MLFSTRIKRSSLLLAGLLCASGVAFAQTDKPTVFASTNVWGSVAQAVGGDNVSVISGINKPDQDPHDYEASAHDKLDISHAALVLVNGGGYDDWAGQLAESVNNAPIVLNAVDISGLKPAGEDEFNEHVFYSLPSVKKVAHAVAEALAEADPEAKQQFMDNDAAFAHKIDDLIKEAQAVGADKQLKAVFTEPVVGYLLETMNIANITPEAFVEQSETDAGPSAKALLDTVTLLKDKKANLLVLNAQTEDDASAALEKAAEEAGIPVVKVYETFPNGITTYPALLEKTIGDFQQAVGK